MANTKLRDLVKEVLSENRSELNESNKLYQDGLKDLRLHIDNELEKNAEALKKIINDRISDLKETLSDKGIEAGPILDKLTNTLNGLIVRMEDKTFLEMKKEIMDISNKL